MRRRRDRWVGGYKALWSALRVGVPPRLKFIQPREVWQLCRRVALANTIDKAPRAMPQLYLDGSLVTKKATGCDPRPLYPTGFVCCGEYIDAEHLAHEFCHVLCGAREYNGKRGNTWRWHHNNFKRTMGHVLKAMYEKGWVSYSIFKDEAIIPKGLLTTLRRGSDD